MPQKSKLYDRARFSPDVIRQSLAVFTEIERPRIARAFPDNDASSWTAHVSRIAVATGDEEWTFDSIDEAFAEYRKGCQRFSFEASGYPGGSFRFEYLGYHTNVAVSLRERGEVERVFEVFEEHVSESQMPVVEFERPPKPPVVIFIEHGRNSLWRDLKDHLRDHQGLTITAYETGVRAGQSIQEVLAEMVNESSLALLVHTAEDVDSEGLAHARENVIHETGLFQGRLGLRRAIILREEGCEPFSNISGTQELRFTRGNIREVFGDVVAIVRREFGSSL